ncbi:MAG: hypothetical protein K2X50_00375 [Gammaproteobacteria bacterium]|nr:hypothetical protein [Gammaproteobacteria bacterium]
MAKDYTLHLDETIKGSMDQDTLNSLIQITITRIGTEVSWDHFESYLASKIPKDDERFDNLHAIIFAHFQDLEKSEESLDSDLTKLTFKNTQSAQAFLAFTQHTFPVINSEYPKIDNIEIILTEEQLFFCRRAAKLKTGLLSADTLSDYYLKTLRADEFDYSDRFIKGIIPGPNDTRRLQNLRSLNRLKFTVAGNGAVESRIEKATSIVTDKKSFSQIQSCTLLDSKALTPAFGFDRDRNPKLYGILSYRKDVKPNRLLLTDGGTVCRPFDSDTEKAATNLSTEMRNPHYGRLYSPEELEQFKKAKIKQLYFRDKTNEVLARIRFDPFRSMICICADNLEARLLAFDFAEETLEHYAEYAKRNGWTLNQKFRIPIIFYLKNTTWVYTKRVTNLVAENPLHNIFIYTREMRKNDLSQSDEISNSKDAKNEKVAAMNFEFLLGLKSITAEVLLEPIRFDTPLAMEIIRTNHIRMLLRLLRPGRQHLICPSTDTQPLTDLVFNSLISERYFKKNDSIISHLIVAEAFELATKVIDATESRIDDLEIKEESNGKILTYRLTIYIIRKGNPRHFEYLGLDETLKKAAQHHYWVTVRLCLKEFPQISQETIHSLFSTACNQRHDSSDDSDIVFLLRRKSISAKHAKEVFQNALTKKRWGIIELLITHYQNIEIFELSIVLIEALRNKQHKLANLILSKHMDPGWRFLYGQKYFLTSALFFGIQHDYNALIPQLWELEREHLDGYTETRFWLAVDLARIRKNSQALTALSAADSTRSLIDPNNTKLSICYLIFEALFANQSAIAEYRLNHYGHQYQLLPANHRNTITTMHLFLDDTEATLTHFGFLLYHSDPTYVNAFFESLVELSFKYKDISFLRTVQIILLNKLGISIIKTEEIIITSSLKKISPNNIEIIQSMIFTSTRLDLWHPHILDKIQKFSMKYRLYGKNSALIYTLILTIRQHDSNLKLDDQMLEDVFEHAICSKNTILTGIILQDMSLSESQREKLFTVAISYSESRYFLYLMSHYNFTLTHKHLSLKSSPHSYYKIILILQELQKEKYKNKFSAWDYFNLWQISTVYDDYYEGKSTDNRKLWLPLLEPHIIRHFTLITLVVLFNNRYKAYMGSFWPNLQSLLCCERVKKGTDETLIYNDKSKITLENCDHHPKLLKTLNDYFGSTDKIPDEVLINDTYQEVMEILQQALPPAPRIPFFNRSKRGLFNYETYHYLQNIDILIRQNNVEPYQLTTDEIDYTRVEIEERFNYQRISAN